MSNVASDVQIIKGDCIIAVCGATGAGKSSFIEMVTQIPGLSGHNLHSETSAIRSIRILRQDKRPVVLVDTPGFDDTFMSDVQVLKMLGDWLKQNYDANALLDGILFLHRISDNRFSGSARKNLNMFEKLCGHDALRKVALVTTMWDMVKENVGDARQNELEKSFWADFKLAHAQTARFNPATEAQAWHIIDELVDRESRQDEPQTIQLQRELAELGIRLNETAAGRELRRELQELLDRQKALEDQLRKEGEGAHGTRAQLADLGSNMQVTLQQLRAMKIPFHRKFLRMWKRKR